MSKKMRPDAITRAMVHGCFTDPAFDRINTAALQLAIGKPLAPGRTQEALAVALSNAVASYAFDYWRQVGPDSDTLEAQAKEVSGACRLLLEAVGINQNPIAPRPVEPESLYPALANGGLFASAAMEGAESGEEAVMSALRAVGDLKRWSDALAGIARKRAAMRLPVAAAKGGRPKNHALDKLLESLTEIFFEGWDEVPSVSSSRSTGTPDDAESAVAQGGLEARSYETGEAVPVNFLRMMCEVMAVIRERGLPAPETPSAIEKAWRRWRSGAPEWNLGQ
jgi:hypothetical protein